MIFLCKHQTSILNDITLAFTNPRIDPISTTVRPYVENLFEFFGPCSNNAPTTSIENCQQQQQQTATRVQRQVTRDHCYHISTNTDHIEVISRSIERESRRSSYSAPSITLTRTLRRRLV